MDFFEEVGVPFCAGGMGTSQDMLVILDRLFTEWAPVRVGRVVVMDQFTGW